MMRFNETKSTSVQWPSGTLECGVDVISLFHAGLPRLCKKCLGGSGADLPQGLCHAGHLSAQPCVASALHIKFRVNDSKSWWQGQPPCCDHALQESKQTEHCLGSQNPSDIKLLHLHTEKTPTK